MTRLYIQPNTQKKLDMLVHDLPQSLVFTGPEGVGLSAAISYVAHALLTQPIYVLPEKNESIDTENGVITIDIIRRLYMMTKTIETGTRLIVIDYAERMGFQAQNAFLKLLEEPGKNKHFILLTHNVSKLLPTIQSRVQIIEIHPITLEQSEKLLDSLKIHDKVKRSQLLFIASGLPAQLTLLARNATIFEQRAQMIRDARTFIQGSLYDRLKLALLYKDDRAKSLLLLVDAMKLVQGALKTNHSADHVLMIAALLKAHERIEANGNIRLQLAAAVL
ncbi:MAG: hypothetical protein EOT05_03415 [Candidatus Microsaccharimonas sossegonensis]|uniref:AAA family ATPase n=1 Tax=Candidatus Microsaccharimonas sossegonensis TaxID=2506948 RepID=A0A4Q0AJB4_9BACT|nr:MAG: hypothetical protein EOT05_03415 [Candidatus Microsaccharimonas sossegonensis]